VEACRYNAISGDAIVADAAGTTATGTGTTVTTGGSDAR
jgi:hypothetical protein